MGPDLNDMIWTANLMDPIERLMLADAMEEAGRHEEARTLRATRYAIYRTLDGDRHGYWQIRSYKMLPPSAFPPGSPRR